MSNKSGLVILYFFFILVLLPQQSNAHEINPKLIYQLTSEKINHNHPIASTIEQVADPRFEIRTYYSFPEWYIVYSAQEYGAFVTSGARPSQFPYFTAIAQLWHSWDESKQLAQAEPDNTTKTILWTIAVSFTIEYSLTGVYENTIGRISEWLHFGHKTVEDMYIDAQAVQYGNFLNQEPWYEFPYLSTLNGLWKTWGWSSFSPRGIERRIAYTVGYASKSLYASIIRALSQANFEGGAGLITKVTVIASENQVTILQLPFKSLPEINHYFVEFPRYRAFRDPAVAVAQSGAEFKDIEGHDYISLSVVMDTLNACDAILQADGYSMSIPSQPKLSRYVLSTPVSELTNTINSILDCNYQIEHIYDY